VGHAPDARVGSRAAPTRAARVHGGGGVLAAEVPSGCRWSRLSRASEEVWVLFWSARRGREAACWGGCGCGAEQCLWARVGVNEGLRASGAQLFCASSIWVQTFFLPRLEPIAPGQVTISSAFYHIFFFETYKIGAKNIEQTAGNLRCKERR